MRAAFTAAFGLSLLMAMAAESPAQNTPAKKDEPKKEAPPLTDQTLLEMIKKLGFEPKIYGSKKNLYQVKISTDDFNSVFSVYLSDSKTRLWFVAESDKLVAVDAIPRPVLMKLLDLSDQNFPYHFTLDEQGQRVYLQFSISNEGVDSAALSQRIDDLGIYVRKTWPNWKYSVLQPPRPAVDSAAAGKERQKFLGTWSIDSFTDEGVTKPASDYEGYKYTFRGTHCLHGNKKIKRFELALDPETSPAQLEFRTDLSSTDLGIYKLEGDTLTICLDTTGKSRPEKFEAPKDSNRYVLVLKRDKQTVNSRGGE